MSKSIISQFSLHSYIEIRNLDIETSPTKVDYPLVWLAFDLKYQILIFIWERQQYKDTEMPAQIQEMAAGSCIFWFLIIYIAKSYFVFKQHIIPFCTATMLFACIAMHCCLYLILLVLTIFVGTWHPGTLILLVIEQEQTCLQWPGAAVELYENI